MLQPSLAVALRVKEQHEPALLALPGVFGVAIGSGADHSGPEGPCIVVLASAALPDGAVPDSIEGVAVYVVRAEPPRQQRL
ncbi:MAG: hypothetical protein R3B70_03890 [Polyangiaceae bacterium]